MLTVNTKYKEWVKVKHNYSYIVVFDFYPLFILCINTQRGCHTLKLRLMLYAYLLRCDPTDRYEHTYIHT